MLSKVDEEEKIKTFMNLNNSKVGSNTWFLTEDGLYEVLMQSRKPIIINSGYDVNNHTIVRDKKRLRVDTIKEVIL